MFDIRLCFFFINIALKFISWIVSEWSLLCLGPSVTPMGVLYVFTVEQVVIVVENCVDVCVYSGRNNHL